MDLSKTHSGFSFSNLICSISKKEINPPNTSPRRVNAPEMSRVFSPYRSSLDEIRHRTRVKNAGAINQLSTARIGPSELLKNMGHGLITLKTIMYDEKNIATKNSTTICFSEAL
jgi:hypothetical protein